MGHGFLDYDLIRIFEHPLSFRYYLPSTIALFGGAAVGEARVSVRWRLRGEIEATARVVRLRWDTANLISRFAELLPEIENLQQRDNHRAGRVEMAAAIVAIATLAHADPQARFTRRSRIGTGHDYYLNETRTEMIEVAGRWTGGLPTLFEQKRAQSKRNPTLARRLVSVTVFARSPRSRTEDL